MQVYVRRCMRADGGLTLNDLQSDGSVNRLQLFDGLRVSQTLRALTVNTHDLIPDLRYDSHSVSNCAAEHGKIIIYIHIYM